jgi:hypothetical protein
MSKEDNLSSAEWSTDEWTSEWTIRVGKAYFCQVCGTMVMVTKGGIGVIEPRCCGKVMREVAKPDEIR